LSQLARAAGGKPNTPVLMAGNAIDFAPFSMPRVSDAQHDPAIRASPLVPSHTGPTVCRRTVPAGGSPR
jgi:hypothetical protein